MSESFPVPGVPEHILLRQVGRRSYGDVWLARSTLGEYRAVKIVRRLAFDEAKPYEREREGVRRFEPISRQHPNLVQILQFGETGDYFYYIMELADGIAPGEFVPETYQPRTLKAELLAANPLAVDECLKLGRSIAQALAILHGYQLVHRDVKPSNIIRVRGEPKLADIGLVAATDATLSHLGSLGYQAPEGPGKPSADIYALGKVLYETGMGQHPNDFPEVKNLDMSLSGFNQLILRACSPAPTDRPTAPEMAEELTALIAANREQEKNSAKTVKSSAAGTKQDGEETKRMNKNVSYTIIGLLSLMVVIMGVLLAKQSGSQATNNAQNNNTENTAQNPGSGGENPKPNPPNPATPSTPDKPTSPHEPPTPPIPTIEKPEAKPGEVIWEWASKDGRPVLTPALGYDGNIYVTVMSSESLFNVIERSTGELIQSFPKGSHGLAGTLSPTVLRDGCVLQPFNSGIVKYKKTLGEFKEEWSRQISDGYYASGFTSAAVGENNLAYLTTERYRKILAFELESGAVKWEFQGKNIFYAIRGESGELKWKYEGENILQFGFGDRRNADAICDGKGLVYVVALAQGEIGRGILVALDERTGARKWEWVNKNHIIYAPVIDGKGIIYFGSGDGTIFAVNSSDGAVVWEKKVAKTCSSPAIGDDGAIYIASLDRHIYAINSSDGGVLWKVRTGDENHSSPLIDNAGILYVGSNDGRLYAIATSSTGPAKSPWPMYGQNAQRTHRAPRR